MNEYPFKVHINPFHGLIEYQHQVSEIFCGYTFEPHARVIGLLSSDKLSVYGLDDGTLRGEYPHATKLATNKYNVETTFKILDVDGIHDCTFSGQCEPLIAPHAYQCKILSANAYVGEDDIIYSYMDITGSGNEYFSQMGIKDMASVRQSLVILTNGGSIYAFIHDNDKNFFLHIIPNTNCPFGLLAVPCLLISNPNQHISSFDFTENGILTLSQTKTIRMIADDAIRSHMHGSATIQRVIHYNQYHPVVAITLDKKLLTIGHVDLEHRAVHFGDIGDGFRTISPKQLNIKSMHSIDLTNIILTKNNQLVRVGTNDLVSLPLSEEKIVATYIIPYSNGQIAWITENALFVEETGLSVSWEGVRLEQISIYRNTVTYLTHIFIKTSDHRLAYAIHADGILSKKFISDDYFVEDLTDNVLKIRSDDQILYYAIGENYGQKFGTVLPTDFIYVYDIQVGAENTIDFLSNFGNIHFDSIMPSSIRNIFHTKHNVLILTMDYALYGRGSSSSGSLGTPQDIVTTFTKVVGVFGEKPVCHVYASDSTIFFVNTCDGKLYQQGHYFEDVIDYDSEGVIKSRYPNDVMSYEVDLPHPVKYLKGVASSNMLSIFGYSFHNLDCIGANCAWEDDMDLVGEEILLDDSVTVITANVTIHDGSIVVVMPNNATDIPIIIDGGQLTLNSTTLIYEINYQDVFNAIQDGQSIIIVDTKGDGKIEGGFDQLELRFSNIDDACKEIIGSLEQSSEQISVIFKVKDTCQGFPVWAILVIVIGVVIILIVIIVLVYFFVIKKKSLYSFKGTKKSVKQKDSTLEGKNATYQGNTFKSPLYEVKE